MQKASDEAYDEGLDGSRARTGGIHHMIAWQLKEVVLLDVMFLCSAM
jgi:hypothetical protein